MTLIYTGAAKPVGLFPSSFTQQWLVAPHVLLVYYGTWQVRSPRMCQGPALTQQERELSFMRFHHVIPGTPFPVCASVSLVSHSFSLLPSMDVGSPWT